MLGACFAVAKCHKHPRLITSFYGMLCCGCPFVELMGSVGREGREKDKDSEEGEGRGWIS